jgi:aspartyl-tRNA(Asn)/glutamyl-tRNA(Gln) amidotransferase subunit B
VSGRSGDTAGAALDDRAAAGSGERYELVVGLEIHVQLRTRTKAFCACSNEQDAAPNTNTCPVCLGMPGALPVLNENAVILAARAALALDSRIAPFSCFERKAYFCPDLPKGYQITQKTTPFAEGGRLEVGRGPSDEPITVGIERIQIEEDAARLLHDKYAGATAIDFNRAGIPVIEIVTEPSIKSAEAAVAFVKVLKLMLDYAGVSDLSMEKGSMRVDVNVSVRKPGDGALGPRTEVKNVNSFDALGEAIRLEFDRQCGLHSDGEEATPLTTFWDGASRKLRRGRPKEGAADYRYFADPDLPPLVIDRLWINQIEATMPESFWPRRERFVRDYGLPLNSVEVLTASAALANYFEQVALHHGDPRRTAAWVMGEVLAEARARCVQLDRLPVRPDDLAELLDLIDSGVLTTSAAKRAFAIMAASGERAAGIVAREGLLRVSDVDRLDAWLDEVLEEEPELLGRLRSGEERLRDAIIGEVMRRSDGAADPVIVNQLVTDRLGR